VAPWRGVWRWEGDAKGALAWRGGAGASWRESSGKAGDVGMRGGMKKRRRHHRGEQRGGASAAYQQRCRDGENINSTNGVRNIAENGAPSVAGSTAFAGGGENGGGRLLAPAAPPSKQRGVTSAARQAHRGKYRARGHAKLMRNEMSGKYASNRRRRTRHRRRMNGRRGGLLHQRQRRFAGDAAKWHRRCGGRRGKGRYLEGLKAAWAVKRREAGGHSVQTASHQLKKEQTIRIGVLSSRIIVV